MNKTQLYKLGSAVLLVLIAAIFAPCLLDDSYAGIGDVGIPWRSGSTVTTSTSGTTVTTSTNSSLYLPPIGPNGTYALIPGGTNAGSIVVNGTNGPQLSPCGPVVSSTGNILTTGALPGTTGTTPVIGQLGLSSSGTLMIFGTNSAWKNVP